MKKDNRQSAHIRTSEKASDLVGSNDKGIENINQENSSPLVSDPMKRRRFLGMGLLGFAGLGLPSVSRSETNSSVESFVNKVITTSADKTTSQTDSIEEKIKLLQESLSRKDYRTARAITNSIRISEIQAQAEEENFGTPHVAASQFGTVESLPPVWKNWAKGWKYYKVISIEEKIGIQRKAEPVEVLLSFQSSQTASLAREIRVAEIRDGILTEVISQVFSEVRRGSEKICKLLFLADNLGKEKRQYLVFYGNPDAELPNYQSDLKVTGEGYGLDIENEYFTAILSKQTGQLARMILKREHGLEIYSGGQGHGEPAGIDWAHDYVSDDGIQKMRISLWDECPDFEVVKGPICTIVRRWGFPYSPVHPLFSPARMIMDIEYRFYAGLPYFHKFGHMTAVKQFSPAALRDDEWVITGQSFTDMLWMGPDEKLKTGPVPEELSQKLWGIGFFNKDTKDSFFGFFLEHYAEGLGAELLHNGSPNLHYQWHGQIWSRYPVPKTIKTIPKGAVLHQKNAYVTIPFTLKDDTARLENLRQELLNPLTRSGSELAKGITVKESPRRLARASEAQDSPISKSLLWEALKLVKDPQLYKADINIVDLGLVYDIAVRGSVVKVTLAMPHRGRPLGAYFTHSSNVVHSTVSKTMMEALYAVPGVRKVIMEQTWYPLWNVNFLTDTGREKLGL